MSKKHSKKKPVGATMFYYENADNIATEANKAFANIVAILSELSCESERKIVLENVQRYFGHKRAL